MITKSFPLTETSLLIALRSRLVRTIGETFHTILGNNLFWSHDKRRIPCDETRNACGDLMLYSVLNSRSSSITVGPLSRITTMGGVHIDGDGVTELCPE